MEGGKTTKWDLRSDGRHPNIIGKMTQDHDRESDGRQQNKTSKTVQTTL